MRAWSWCLVAALCVGGAGCERPDEATEEGEGEPSSTNSAPSPVGLLELGDEAVEFVNAPRALEPGARSSAIRDQVRARASRKKLIVRPPHDAGSEEPRRALDLARTLDLPGPALSSDAPTSDLELAALYVALARRAGLDGVVLTQAESQVPGTGRGLMVGGYRRGGETKVVTMVREEAPSLLEFEVLTDVEFEGLHMAEGAMAALNRSASDQAVELAERATELAPRRAFTWSALASALERKEDVYGARRAFDRALAVRKTRAMVARKVELMTASGAAKQALALVESELEGHAQDTNLLRALGRAACALDDGARAADAFEASAREGMSWESWRDAAVASAAAGESARALESIRRGRLLHEEPALWDELAKASASPRAKWSTRSRRLARELGACAEAKEEK